MGTADSSESWIELVLKIPSADFELLISELEFIGWEAFLEEEDALHAYRAVAGWTEQTQRNTHSILVSKGLADQWHYKTLPQQNWNAEWEASIKPVSVPPFFIHPSWYKAAIEPGCIPIVIDPKMSFGTGYHETTRIMLRLIDKYAPVGQRVLDAGSGTGILAIASAKKGASSVFAFDTDEWVAENLIENIEKNECSGTVSFQIGSLDSVQGDQFDLVLANINRNVLVEYIEGFAEKCGPRGKIILSGLLQTDVAGMDKHAHNAGLRRIDEEKEAEWWGGVYAPILRSF